MFIQGNYQLSLGLLPLKLAGITMANCIRLNTKIQLQHLTIVKDSTGGKIKTWTTYSNPWAKVFERRLGRAGENFEADQKIAKIVREFVVRYRTDISSKDAVVYKSRIWDVVDWFEMTKDGAKPRTYMKIIGEARAE